MRRTDKVFKQVQIDFAHYHFEKGAFFKWSPQSTTIFYAPLKKPEDLWSLLHEIAHGELNHTSYGLDVELVDHEAQAWRFALDTLAPQYNLVIEDAYVQEHLDTYREWLHARSMCPDCGQNGLQTQNTYSCMNCRCLWRANEARLCDLRRTKLRDQGQL